MAREGEAIIRPLADRLALMQPEPRVELQIPQLQKPFGHNILTQTHTLGSVIKEAQAGEREERSFPQKPEKKMARNTAPPPPRMMPRRLSQTSNGSEAGWMAGWSNGWLAYWPVLIHRWRPSSACRFWRRPNGRMAKMVKLLEPLSTLYPPLSPLEKTG